VDRSSESNCFSVRAAHGRIHDAARCSFRARRHQAPGRSLGTVDRICARNSCLRWLVSFRTLPPMPRAPSLACREQGCPSPWDKRYRARAQVSVLRLSRTDDIVNPEGVQSDTPGCRMMHHTDAMRVCLPGAGLRLHGAHETVFCGTGAKTP